MASGIGNDLAIVDTSAGTGCLEWIASLTLSAQVVLVDHKLTREELHVRSASPARRSDCFSLVERLNVVSFLVVPGLSCRPHRMLETSNRVILCGARLGLLITFDLMVCLVLPCYSVVPGLPCRPLVETTPVSFGLLRSARLVLRFHFELMVCLVRPAGRWHQACPGGHACGWHMVPGLSCWPCGA